MSQGPGGGAALGRVAWPTWEEQCTGRDGCWPRLLMLGTQKAATTALFQALQQERLVCGARVHPGVNYTSSGWQPNSGDFVQNQDIKEVHLLDATESGWQDVAANAKKYTSLFRHTDCQQSGDLPGRRFLDATPAYLRTSSAPARLVQIVPQRWLPELRMLILVREPIARDLSWYNHKLSENEERKRAGSSGRFGFCAERLSGSSSSPALTYSAEASCQKSKLNTCMSRGAMLQRIHLHESFNFEEKMQMLQEYWVCTNPDATDDGGGPSLTWGFYAPQIATWRSAKGLMRSQMLIIDYEDLFEKSATTLNVITSFYGLPRLRNTRLPKANTKASSAKLETISCSTKQLLTEIYRPWNRMLFNDLWQDHEQGNHPQGEPRFQGFGDSRVKCSDATMSPTAEAQAPQKQSTTDGEFSASVSGASEPIDYARGRRVFAARGRLHTNLRALIQPSR